MGVINKIVGTHSQRELKRHNHTIEKTLSMSVTGWYYLTSGTYRRNENR